MKEARVKRRLKKRLKRIEKAAEHVEEIAERRKRLKGKEQEKYPPEAAKASLTDPDCQFMQVGMSKEPAYNVQMTVDGESEFIVAKEVSSEPTDVNRLLPGIEKTKQNLG